MKRLFKILAFISVIYGVTIYGGFAPMPFKVTDPSDPRFNINRFRFEDYPTGDELQVAMQKILPVDTPLEEVDRILVDIGGAKKSPASKLDIYRQEYYDHPELYRVHRYFKISWVALFYQKIIPVPGRPDRLVTVEIGPNNKTTLVVAHR